GVDEACCGIRSFQAVLMLSIFFGAFYRLQICWRLGLVVIGVVLAFAFNAVRTTVLASVVANKGMNAIAAWHDPAGLIIPVACFGGLGGIALLVGPQKRWTTAGAHNFDPRDEPINHNCRSANSPKGSTPLADLNETDSSLRQPHDNEVPCFASQRQICRRV